MSDTTPNDDSAWCDIHSLIADNALQLQRLNRAIDRIERRIEEGAGRGTREGVYARQITVEVER